MNRLDEKTVGKKQGLKQIKTQFIYSIDRRLIRSQN